MDLESAAGTSSQLTPCVPLRPGKCLPPKTSQPQLCRDLGLLMKMPRFSPESPAQLQTSLLKLMGRASPLQASAGTQHTFKMDVSSSIPSGSFLQEGGINHSERSVPQGEGKKLEFENALPKLLHSCPDPARLSIRLQPKCKSSFCLLI